MSDTNLRAHPKIQKAPPRVSRVTTEITNYIDKLAKQGFTGEVTFKLRYNQGGIRESRVALDRSL
jgi:hypothetical protein